MPSPLSASRAAPQPRRRTRDRAPAAASGSARGARARGARGAVHASRQAAAPRDAHGTGQPQPRIRRSASAASSAWPAVTTAARGDRRAARARAPRGGGHSCGRLAAGNGRGRSEPSGPERCARRGASRRPVGCAAATRGRARTPSPPSPISGPRPPARPGARARHGPSTIEAVPGAPGDRRVHRERRAAPLRVGDHLDGARRTPRKAAPAAARRSARVIRRARPTTSRAVRAGPPPDGWAKNWRVLTTGMVRRVRRMTVRRGADGRSQVPPRSTRRRAAKAPVRSETWLTVLPLCGAGPLVTWGWEIALYPCAG